MSKRFLVLGMSLLLAHFCFGQTELQKIEELEARKVAERQRQMNLKLDSAVKLMDKEEYEAADEKFLQVLKGVRSVPSDLTFYFGKNSYFLGKYKQSIDWLNKYIQLKGTTGQFSDEAIKWKQLAEADLLKEKLKQVEQTKQVLAQDYTIDCGPTGKVICPVCNGSTVIIKKDYLGDKYKTCGYCDTHGFLTCDEYNLLLKGQLKPHSRQ